MKKYYSTLANPSEKTKSVLLALGRVETPNTNFTLRETMTNLEIRLERVDFNTVCVSDANGEWFHWSIGGSWFIPRASKFREDRALHVVDSLNKFNESRAKPFSALGV